MKAILILATIFLGQAAMACVDGQTGTVTIRANNDEGAQEQFRTCVGGTYMTPAEKAAYIYNPRTKCVDGQKGTVTLTDEDGRSFEEQRTCKGGTYMTPAEKAAYVSNPKFSCKKGTYETWSVLKAGDDHPVAVRMLCTGSRWVEAGN